MVSACVEIKFYGAFVLNHRVVLHAIDATPARRRGDAGSSPLDGATSSYPTHRLISTQVSRHLDSSLIDLDIHPAYVSVVIKSKVLRLKLPSEVNASLSTAKRSKVTGHLLIEMPKVNENAPTLFGKNKARAEKEERLKRLNGERKPGLGAPPTQSKKQSVGVHAKPLDNRRPALSASMADLMVKDSSSRRKKDGMAAVSTRRVDDPPPPPVAAVPTDDDDDEPPPPC